MFLVGLALYKTGNLALAGQVLAIITIVVVMVFSSSREFFIYKFSPKLRSLSQEIQTILTKLADHNLDIEFREEESRRQEVIAAFPRAEPEVYLADDFCSYLNTHWHPTLEQGFEFIRELVNEEIFFVQSKITKRNKAYPGYKIEESLTKNQKRRVRIFSSVKIYKE